jgi:lysylphosphatidylglycerol synthetase-like protein (DUF2156 family)
MSDLATLAQRLVVDRVFNAAPSRPGPNLAVMVFVVLIGSLIVLGLGFLVFATHLWLQDHYQPDVAAALTGLFILCMAVSCLCAYITIRVRHSHMQKLQNEMKETLQAALSFCDEELADMVSENPKTAILIASLAGFAAAKNLP